MFYNVPVATHLPPAPDGVLRCVAACHDLRHLLFCTDLSDTAERAPQYVEGIVASAARFVLVEMGSDLE